jgi:hypothetical protein
VHVDHIAALAGIPDAATVMDELRRRLVVQAHSPRYTLTAPLPPAAFGASEEWKAAGADYFTSLAERHHSEPGALVDDLDAMLATLELAASDGRQGQVVRLGRALEPGLVRAGRWEAAHRVTKAVLAAARATGNRSAEGWALHQLGTRALCLDDADSARLHLARRGPADQAVTR